MNLHTSGFYIYFFFLPSLSKKMFELIYCREIGSHSYISYNTVYKCNSQEYTVWTYYIIIPIAFLLIFGLPCYAYWNMRNQIKVFKNKLNKHIGTLSKSQTDISVSLPLYKLSYRYKLTMKIGLNYYYLVAEYKKR